MEALIKHFEKIINNSWTFEFSSLAKEYGVTMEQVRQAYAIAQHNIHKQINNY